MKSGAGYVLSLIGGIFSILFSLVVGVVTLLFGVLAISIPETSLGKLENFSKVITMVSGLGALWFLIIGILIIIFAIDINDDRKTRKGGLACLILGILSVNIFAIIGGILALVVSGKDSYDARKDRSIYSISSSNVRKI